MSNFQNLVDEVLADSTLPAPLRQALQLGQALERITLDEEGRWWHEDALIESPRIVELFHRSITRTPGGTYLLHVPPFSYPITVKDAPFIVRRITISPNETPPVRIFLSDGSEEPLDLSSLRYVPGRGFYCRVKGGTFDAHFCRPAYYSLAEYLEEGPFGYRLCIGNTSVPLHNA